MICFACNQDKATCLIFDFSSELDVYVIGEQYSDNPLMSWLVGGINCVLKHLFLFLMLHQKNRSMFSFYFLAITLLLFTGLCNPFTLSDIALYTWWYIYAVVFCTLYYPWIWIESMTEMWTNQNTVSTIQTGFQGKRTRKNTSEYTL